ncbi:MAG: sigma-70 family RNA polymerase sigma factor [Planctomycetaceae bacterium]|nr:sigma-70 family RNA polymerase sigma factor [Planctomycetaceae bacterium]
MLKMPTPTAVEPRKPPVTSGLRHEAEELLKREIAYVHSRSFERLTVRQLDSERPTEMYSESPSLIGSGQGGLQLTVGVNVQLLSPEGEAYLFRRMNYFLFRANTLRAKLDSKRPSQRTLDQLKLALKEAQAARGELVQSNVRLVAGLAGKFSGNASDYEELVSEGNLILLKAIDKFDIDRGFRFSTYATHAVQRHFFRVIQRRHRRKGKETAVPSDVLADSLLQPEVENEIGFDEGAVKELLRQFSGRLDERESQIIQGRYNLGGEGKGKTLKCLASEMGLSKERVRQLQHRALEKLREVAAELNLVPEELEV